MTNVFSDSKTFMDATGQTRDVMNKAQFDLYVDLINEEHTELLDSIGENGEVDWVETLDALVDILVVTVGAIHSMGADGEGAWNEVMRTNFAKVDPDTGKVLRRADGKILKPDGWKAPELAQYVKGE